ncbi:short-chain dehydrogenase [Ophiostoma piceae UAMH 11346]|uniref:Short-chain dehydrogenase n=1 Tax=Ophiostoma piceae (strain UAMH 11346) TaxID=1262450 RepID=S3C037_OPHP1|nr:short-chain dehydrogenase [Ophiostoma piceae UAMH 11346]
MASAQLLAGKVAGITGGLTGIGRAIALEYIRQGAKVGVNHFGGPGDEPHLKSFLEEVSTLISSKDVSSHVVTVAGDISKPETGQQLVEKIVSSFPEQRLDIFVSNAGVCQFSEFLDLSPALLEHTVGTNLNGAFYAVQAAGRQMALNQTPSGGSIIGISSISALVGGGQQTHYTPTKAGVKSLMQSCAVALGKYGIRCNSLLPGTIRTQLNDVDLADDAKRIYTEGRTPLGRLGQTRDLAGPAVFLASDELSSFVTGAELLVDGGLFVNLQ